jgi:CelD/BcsL family acetyltransferase involved in cellulose biosynthesis
MKTEKLSALSDTWESVFCKTPNRSPFLSYEWFDSLSRDLLKTNPEVFTFRSNGSIVGILPACIEGKTLRLLNDERVTDVCDILYLPEYEREVINTIASMMSSQDLNLDLFPLEKTSPLISTLLEFFGMITVEKIEPSPILPLPPTWEGYLNSLTGKQRHELRRKLKKISKVTLQEVNAENIEVLFSLMSSSSNEKQEFLTEEMRSFFFDIASSFSKRKWLRFRIAYLDSRPIGAIFSFSAYQHIYLYNMGYDPEFISLSPGIITIALDIKEAINEKAQFYHFLRGNEKYKYNLGGQEQFIWRVRQ